MGVWTRVKGGLGAESGRFAESFCASFGGLAFEASPGASFPEPSVGISDGFGKS